MELVRDDTRPSQILTREAFENAIAAVAGTGGSTNGVLHLLAIAARGGRRPLELDDFDTIAARTPIVADLKPGGRYVATDLLRGRRRRRSSRASSSAPASMHEDARGVDGRTLARGRGRRRTRRPGQDVVVPWDDAAQADRRPRDPARLARARGLRRQARRPRAAAPPRARRASSTPRRTCFAAVKARAIEPGDVVVIRYEGPAGGPGHARDAARDRARSSARGSATRSR